MKLSIKKFFKEGDGSRTILLYILLLLLAVLTMGILLYFLGPAIKEIQIPAFQNAKKYFLIIVIIVILTTQIKKKLA